MGLFHKRAQYLEYRRGVSHCTFDPDGPGAVRIHLVPPKFHLFKNAPYIVILNGYYLLPLGYSWAILLSNFMYEVNRFEGRPITDADEEKIVANTVASTKKAYPSIPAEELREDLAEMLDILFAVAQGQGTDADIGQLSMRAYAKEMTAPHRMDLMVSAMTDESGAWKCNQKCRFCYAAGEEMGKTEELPTADWYRIIDRLREAHVPMLTFTGGEPTQRADLAKLIDYAKWFVTRVNTNGVLLTDKLVSDFKAAGLDSLQVTLYSHSAAVHNDLTGASHFEDTVAGIRRAVTAGLDVSVNTPLCKKNADYGQTLEFIHSLGVRFVTVSGLICTGTAEHNHAQYDLDGDALYEIVARAKAFCDAHEMEMDFTSPGLIAKERLEALALHVPMCGAALSNMAVAPNGDVLPCQSWLTGNASLGNLLTARFADIWKHPLCRSLRKMREDEALACPFRTGKGGV